MASVVLPHPGNQSTIQQTHSIAHIFKRGDGENNDGMLGVLVTALVVAIVAIYFGATSVDLESDESRGGPALW